MGCLARRAQASACLSDERQPSASRPHGRSFGDALPATAAEVSQESAYFVGGGRISRGGTLNALASFHIVRKVIERPASIRW